MFKPFYFDSNLHSQLVETQEDLTYLIKKIGYENTMLSCLASYQWRWEEKDGYDLPVYSLYNPDGIYTLEKYLNGCGMVEI